MPSDARKKLNTTANHLPNDNSQQKLSTACKRDRRTLQDILPPYFQKLRYYGLHASETFRKYADNIDEKLLKKKGDVPILFSVHTPRQKDLKLLHNINNSNARTNCKLNTILSYNFCLYY